MTEVTVRAVPDGHRTKNRGLPGFDGSTVLGHWYKDNFKITVVDQCFLRSFEYVEGDPPEWRT